MNPLEKLAAKKFLIRELSKLAMLPKKLPALGGQKANVYTQNAKRNAQKMGHGARWDFNTRQTMPVNQTTAAAGRPMNQAPAWPKKKPKAMSVASR